MRRPLERSLTGSALKPGVELLPVGVEYEHHARRILEKRSFADDDKLEAERREKEAHAEAANGVDKDAVDSEPESKELLSLDPKEWKKQDQYAVLGLSNLRYKATVGQIQYAHRRKVVRHHPDKKSQADKTHTHGTNDDSFFKCIQKATDTLLDPVKRRQFDSVDPAISDDYPKGAEAAADGDAAKFIELWGPIFEREGRFSKKQPVPTIGQVDSDKKTVESFYDFWLTFDSWRSFEWNDKEAPEGGDSRDEKRFAEKKNKAAREKAKKDETVRLHQLAENAATNDPRIKKFKADAKAAKDAKRKVQKPSAAQLRVEEERKKKEAEEAKKAEDAKKLADGKADRDAAKKAKEQAKKNVKRDRKALSAAVTAANYFVPAGQSPTPDHIESLLAELDNVAAALEPEDLSALRQNVEKVGTDAGAIRSLLAESAAKTPVERKHLV